jgi:hypothetical protein
MIAAFDLLVCLLVVYMLQQNPKATPPRIETFGQFAIIDSWRSGSDDDVDLYVRDPRGNICYFAAPSVGLMHLEDDDLGTANSNTYDQNGETVTVPTNGERTVIRGIIPGEYTVNVQMYLAATPGQKPVQVELWTLRGNDRKLLGRTVTLGDSGSEETVFRFTLDAAGHVSNINRLRTRFTQSAAGSPQDGWMGGS